MIVCLCFGVNSQHLERLKEKGCDSLRKLQSECQAGSCCGACIPDLLKTLKDQQNCAKAQES